MKILLVGNGGREHAVAKALRRSKHNPDIVVYADKMNPGIKSIVQDYFLAKSLLDFDHLHTYVEEFQPDFAFIGPDNPIGEGIVDLLENEGVKSVAPRKAPARLESSKYFARELLEKNFIPGNPRFRRFESEAGIMEFLQELGEEYVVKADGLAYGKGVKVAGDHLRNHEEALKFARECLAQGHSSVVIEEKLYGAEFSLMAFADGEHLVFMPVVQDQKRAHDGDEGPNTGGMGSYSDVNHSLPFLTDQDIEDAKQISLAVLEAVKKETGQAYKGILYGGYMACKDGVKLIEFNARFGDPEVMNVLPILETDFVDVCQAIINGTLDKLDIKFANKATVCLYVVPEGYPDDPMVGEVLEVGEMPKGVELFYSSVNVYSDPNLRIHPNDPNSQEDHERVVTTGSRSIGVVGIGDSIEEARQKALEGVEKIKGRIFYRKDIGSKVLLQKRFDLMKSLRG